MRKCPSCDSSRISTGPEGSRCKRCGYVHKKQITLRMVNRQTPEFLNWFKRNYTLPDYSKLPGDAQDRIFRRYEYSAKKHQTKIIKEYTPPNEHQEVLLEILSEAGRIQSGELYNRYAQKRAGKFTLSKRGYREYMSRIVKAGLAESIGDKSGRGYRKKERDEL